MRGQEFAKRDFKLNTAPWLVWLWLVWLVSSDRLRTNVRQLVTCANGDISTRDCWSKETPVSIIVKPVNCKARSRRSPQRRDGCHRGGGSSTQHPCQLQPRLLRQFTANEHRFEGRLKVRPHSLLRANSETECVNASISASIQAVLRRYQSLKVTEPTQWFAGHDRLPGIAAEPMKPIVALGAKDPYNRI
jgi:hypothetical protein